MSQDARRPNLFKLSPALAIGLALSACAPPSPAPLNSLQSEALTPAMAEVHGQVTLEGAADSSGVQVFVPGGSRMAMSDIEGRFLFTGLEPGAYNFLAQRPGFESASLGVIEVLPDPPGEVFTLDPAELKRVQPEAPPAQAPTFGSISGTVAEVGATERETGPALQGVRISLDGMPMRTISDSDGKFLLWNLDPGAYRLLASAPGYLPSTLEVVVPPGPSPVVVDLGLAPEDPLRDRRAITGSINLVDADGFALADFGLVRVGLRELPDLALLPESDGSFRIAPLPAGPYAVYAFADGFISGEDVLVDLTDLPQIEISLSLSEMFVPEEPSALAGFALKGLEGETDMSGITVAVGGTGIMGLTDTQGRYRLGGIASGVYELIFQADGYHQLVLTEIVIDPGVEIAMESVTLDPTFDYPRVISTMPDDGEKDFLVQYRMPISIHFSKAMDPASIRQGITIDPPLAFEILTGGGRQDLNYDVVRLVIDGTSEAYPPSFQTNYDVIIADSVTDVEGLRMEETYVFEFRTGRPAVIDSMPGDGAEDVALMPQNPIVVRFNTQLDAQSLDPRDIRIRPSLRSVPSVQLGLDTKTGWSTLQIQAAWKDDTRYRVTIPRRLRTRDGGYISNTPYNFSFKTVKLRQFIPPNTIQRR